MLGLFGRITPPLNNPYFIDPKPGAGLFLFISNLFKLAGFIGGLYMIFQFITAGYAYISANGDAKKIEAAWTKIWQSILGLVIISSAFIIAGVVGRLTGINILKPIIYGP
ncbi:MAG: hypothetical protein WC596_03420 [Candidatus Shapirobacteria bacterium]